MAVFSGSAHPQLAHSIARYLRIPLAKAHVGRFSDGEMNVEILENIRGKETFIVQPTCPPTSENLMELLVMVDAVKRASADRITAVIPYFGFARQDRRPRSARVPITAKLVAKLIGTAGVDRVLTVDLHADQIQGFFDIVVDNVYASPILLGDVWKQKYDDIVVVSPDVGGVVRARALAKRLDDADLAIIDKRRPQANMARVMNVIGEVEGKVCVLIDVLVDTRMTRVDRTDGGVRCVVQSKSGEESSLEGAMLLVAVGRAPYVDGLGAPQAGVNVNDASYRETFPYVGYAHSGRDSRHVDAGEEGLPVD